MKKRKLRTRKAAVTAGGTRSQRGSHGDGSPAGTTSFRDFVLYGTPMPPRPSTLRAFFRRSGLYEVPGLNEIISNAFDREFLGYPDTEDHGDQVDVPSSVFEHEYTFETEVNARVKSTSDLMDRTLGPDFDRPDDPTLPASKRIIDVQAKP